MNDLEKLKEYRIAVKEIELKLRDQDNPLYGELKEINQEVLSYIIERF